MSVERMLVVMPNWFGETLFATPLLRALRQGRPEAWIAACGVARAEEVLIGNPCVNEFIRYDEDSPHPWVEQCHLIAELRAKRFDVAIVLRRSLTRTFMMQQARIAKRIGFTNWKSGWLLTDRVRAPKGVMHKAHTYFKLLEPLGAVELPGCYEYVISEPELRDARALLGRHGLPKAGQPVLVLHPGANWPHKRWPIERFAELANRLSAQRACAIVVTGTADDLPMIQAMQALVTAPAVILAGQTTLRQLAACLTMADAVVAGDTGVLHLAAALRRRIVALYGPTSPALTGPLGDPTRTIVLHHPDACPSIPCYSADDPPHAGMTTISVAEVERAVLQLLNQTSA